MSNNCILFLISNQENNVLFFDIYLIFKCMCECVYLCICVSLWRHVHLSEMSTDARRVLGSSAAQVTVSSDDWQLNSGHLLSTVASYLQPQDNVYYWQQTLKYYLWISKMNPENILSFAITWDLSVLLVDGLYYI